MQFNHMGIVKQDSLLNISVPYGDQDLMDFTTALLWKHDPLCLVQPSGCVDAEPLAAGVIIRVALLVTV